MEYPELLMVIYMPIEIVSVQKRYCNERERDIYIYYLWDAVSLNEIGTG